MTFTHHHVKPRTADWFALRERASATMSKVGAIANVDLWTRCYEVWAQQMKLVEPPAETKAMWLGRICEPAVAEAVKERLPDLDLDYPLDLVVEHVESGIMGTPDATGRLRSQPDDLIAFEFKVVSESSFERWWSSGAPLSYQLQAVGNAWLLDAHRAILAALVHGQYGGELVVYDLDRNPAAEAAIRDFVRKYKVAYDAGHAPQPDYARDFETIKAAFPPRKDVPAPIDLSGDNRLPDLLDRHEDLKTTIGKAKKECKTIEAEIIHKLAGAERATLPGWKISNTITHRAEKLQLALDYPVLRVARTKEISL